MRFSFVDGEKANHSVPMLCRVLRVSKSGYYAWKVTAAFLYTASRADSTQLRHSSHR